MRRQQKVFQPTLENKLASTASEVPIAYFKYQTISAFSSLKEVEWCSMLICMVHGE